MMLISESYRKLNQQLHKRPRGFGGSGYRWVNRVVDLASSCQVKSILDYGCGEETLWYAIQRDHKYFAEGIQYFGYDPAMPGKKEMPLPADMVVCTDVLEHVEPEYLTNVLNHINGLARKAIFLNIAIAPANKTLPDGRNTHLIVENEDWWKSQLVPIFTDWWFGYPDSGRWKDFHVSMIRRK